MQFRLSVRELVEFLFQTGDLQTTSQNNERANLGSKIHRLLQLESKEDYQCEVYLKQTTQIDDITFIIDGRADRILHKNNTIIIDEIKTTAIPYDEIDDTIFIHWAQAYCYGYIYAYQQKLEELTIQLTYYQIETNTTKQFQRQLSFHQLKNFYMDFLMQYLKWAKLSQNLRITSSKTLKSLRFPFPQYRQGQHQFAAAVYKTILDKKTLFVQAPTGIGKTISTLFPSLKAIGENKIDKIFYLCAKNITAKVACDTILLIQSQDVSFKTVHITAKDKICFLEERNCDPKHCPYAKGYYNRNKQALYELLTSKDFMSKDVICSIASKYTICPFELSLDASLYADVIICDYNYVFDPRVYLKRFFTEKGNYAFLVDEAHNLIDRGREMYSASIEKDEILKLKHYLPKDEGFLLKSYYSLTTTLSDIEHHMNEETFHAYKDPLYELLDKLETFYDQCSIYLQSKHDEANDETIKDVYFNINSYLKISDLYDENYMTLTFKQDNNFIIKQFCLNPGHLLSNMIKKGRSTIFFSATLSPIEYYMELLGGEQTSLRLSLPSPFKPSQTAVIINNAISTKYHQRNNSLLSIVEFIHSITLAKAGNYIIFAPSYTYMQQIAQEFKHQYPAIQISIQKNMMSEKEKQAYLHQFETTNKLHLYFCVLGGMFSEGIDLKGERLLGSIIIGVGLPQISSQTDIIKQHFNEINNMGYAYAYQFPGMNKVLQAAGRVIRSIFDKGVIVFIDERFTTTFYKKLMPTQYQHYKVINSPMTAYHTLHNFWKETEK